MSDTEILHVGVKGMKWGVRKSPRPKSQDAAKADRIASRKKKNGIKSLSNKDIKTVNDRLQLEKKFKDLNPSTLLKGQAIAGTLIGLAGTVSTLYAIKNNKAVVDGLAAINKLK